MLLFLLTLHKYIFNTLQIRRAAGPLTTVRKVGPELSKKVYLMFSSKNGENVLS